MHRTLLARWTKLDCLKADSDQMLRLLRAVPTSLPTCILEGVWEPGPEGPEGRGLGRGGGGGGGGGEGGDKQRERETRQVVLYSLSLSLALSLSHTHTHSHTQSHTQVDAIGEVADAFDLLARAHARERFNGVAGRGYRPSVA